MPTALSDDATMNPPPVEHGDGDPDPDEPTRWVTVATFWTPPEAHLACLKLESEEIDCQIANENIVAVDFLLAPAVGGIRILVPDFDVERARSFLGEPRGPAADVMPPTFGTCPECGSKNIDRPWLQTKTYWAAFVAIVMLGSVVMLPLGLAGFIYYLLMWRPWRCRDCGNSFRRNDGGAKGFPVAAEIKPSPDAEE